MLLNDATRLISSAALLGVPIDGPQAEALLRLLQELEQWNRSFNLTRITGLTLTYLPQDPPLKRKTSIVKWQQKLDAGQIVYKKS